ncbi:Sentrin-specific protease [Brachionus plicatilis]|uniref:Sentrin-specific protease n=1 Tax=Brachionus plicatilis TaxID=10195 RepID=A0A3M7PGG6_BRAPC|nr:Sentrin-specific protease [Brachionus plicatilis]
MASFDQQSSKLTPTPTNESDKALFSNSNWKTNAINIYQERSPTCSTLRQNNRFYLEPIDPKSIENACSALSPTSPTPSKSILKKKNIPSQSKRVNWTFKVYSSQELILNENNEELDRNDILIVKAYGFDICKSDIMILLSGSKLNDNIVNFYLNLICNSAQKKCVCLDSLLVGKLISSKTHDIKKLCTDLNNTLSYLLFLPINLNLNHWSLLVFDLENKVIYNLDSILKPNFELIRTISFNLSNLFIKLKGVNDWKIKTDLEYPKQTGNSIDCGVFICLYAKYLAFEREFDFNQTNIQNMREIMADEIKQFSIDENFLENCSFSQH